MSSSVTMNERRIITAGTAILIYQDQSCLENGIAFDDLVAAASGVSKYSKKQIEIIVNKELSSGSLLKLQNGNLVLGPADYDEDSLDSIKFEYHAPLNTLVQMTLPVNSSCRSSPRRMRGRPKKCNDISNNGASSSASLNTSVRVSERLKVAKKVFDPSDNNVPNKRKRGRPVGSLNKSTVKKRLMKAGHHKSDTAGAPLYESLVALHGSKKTIKSGSDILKSRPVSTSQGPRCKACVVCCETSDAGTLTVCNSCSDAFHALCHLPCIPKRLQTWDQWQCSKCMLSRPTAVQSPAIIRRSVNCTAQSTLRIDPFLKPHKLDRAPSKRYDALPASIPDITNWTTDDVFEYFTKYFPEAASILKKLEYDGQALSTARRTDIIRSFGLRLGPALGLYRIIVKLQTRKDDYTMCWG